MLSPLVPKERKALEGLNIQQIALGNPACYAYAHQKTPKKKKGNTDGGSSNKSVVGSTTNSNNIALDGCKGMDGMMAKVMDHLYPPSSVSSKKCSVNDDATSLTGDTFSREAKKLKRLENSKKMLMEEIKFQKDLGEDYTEKYNEWLATCAQICKLVNDQNEEM